MSIIRVPLLNDPTRREARDHTRAQRATRLAKQLMFTSVLLFAFLAGPSLAMAQSSQDSLARSTNRTPDKQVYTLQYKMAKGETIRWNVEQIATTDTAMAGFQEASSIRSRSTLVWVVSSVDSLGNMTFRNLLESAKEWHKIGDADPISYDSQSNEIVPEIFKHTADKIGKPISTITLSPSGRVIDRVEEFKTMGLGMGHITVPFPENPIPIGEQWHTPEELTARDATGVVKRIKTRILYTLRDVNDGTATIAFRREILTPVNDAKIKSQLLQKLNQGVIQFDMVQGRVALKHVKWDDKVQGFQGPDSILHYLGTYTMGLQTESARALQNAQLKSELENRKATLLIKPRDGRPIVRK